MGDPRKQEVLEWKQVTPDDVALLVPGGFLLQTSFENSGPMVYVPCGDDRARKWIRENELTE